MCAFSAWCAGPVAVLSAQQVQQQEQRAQPSPVTARPSPTAVPATLATITTDTGAFAWGHTAFTRYDTPSECLMAAQNARAVLRRSLVAQVAADSLHRDPVHDTLPAGAVTVARACSRQFTVATTATAQLPDLFALALLAQQDSLAAAVLARRVTLAPTAAARFALLDSAVQWYLQAEPARVSAAERVVAQLDAQGEKAQLVRVGTHLQLLQFAQLRSDAATIQQEAAQILTLSRAMPPTALASYWDALVAAYRALALSAYLTRPDSLPALVRRAQADLSRVPNGPVRATTPFQEVLALLCPVASVQARGQPLPPVTADVWVPTAAKETVVPVRGRVSLVTYVPYNCYDGYVDANVLDPLHEGCTLLYDQLRRWHTQYGGQGLDITLVAAVAPDLSGTLLSGPQSLAQAVENLRWYFLDYLKLPVQRVAVQAVPVTPPLPAPDGRRGSGIVPFKQTYLGSIGGLEESGGGTVLLTDRHGVEVDSWTVPSGPGNGQYLAQFEQLLQRVVAGPALPASPTVVPAAASPPSAVMPSPSTSGQHAGL